MSGTFLTTVTINIDDAVTDTYNSFDVEVEGYIQDPWQGSARTCPSAEDYYGYQEIKDVTFISWAYYEGESEKPIEGDLNKIPVDLKVVVWDQIEDIDFAEHMAQDYFY